MIFHYHHQWSKQDEKERNIVAMNEHLTYIDALQSRDASAVAKSCNAHLATARQTLLASIHASHAARPACLLIGPCSLDAAEQWEPYDARVSRTVSDAQRVAIELRRGGSAAEAAALLRA